MEERFVKWEGDIFKIVDTLSGFAAEAFKFVDNSWERVSGKLIATLLYEGMPTTNPLQNNGK